MTFASCIKTISSPLVGARAHWHNAAESRQAAPQTSVTTTSSHNSNIVRVRSCRCMRATIVATDGRRINWSTISCSCSSTSNSTSGSRRGVLAGLLSLAAGPQAAEAAVPALTPSAGAGLAGQLNRALSFPLFPVSVEPVGFPRKQLDQRFAVLLMRSSYDAVDALDFIPRQQFEAKFWKLRQSELEGYNLLYAPLKMRQGDLTDPLYFDFISFSQYSTISREMQQPLKLFEEYYEVCPPNDDDAPCESGTTIITRPPQFDDDTQLPTYFFQTTGDLIYYGLRFGFRGEEFGGPPPAPAGASIQQLAAGVQQLLSIMCDKGYALKAEVSDVQPSNNSHTGGSFKATLQGAATQWGMNALSARQSLVVNAFDVMVIDAYLRASGRQGQYSLQLTDAGLQESWVIT